MKSETKLFLGIIIGTVIIVGIGIGILSRPAPVVKVDPSILIRADSQTIKTATASVTLVEFSDFQCPACAVYYSMVKQITKEFKDDVTLVYRNFPLTDLHPNAKMAAQAAEAAGLQGKYWDMHDMLFEKQKDWSDSSAARDIFSQYAQSLGLNVDQFKKDIDSDVIKNRIAQDIQDGTSLGITGTPTFFLNNQKIGNPAGLADFTSLMQSAVNAGKNK